MKITCQQAEDLHAQLDRKHDAAVQAVVGGSYEVVLQQSKTSHMDFTDLPLLESKPADDVVQTLRRFR